MSVLVEAFSVIIRRSTLEAKYPGGVRGYQRDCPNGTFCADEMLTRVGFMNSDDADHFLQLLARVGIIRLRGEHACEIAVIMQREGFLGSCDWLDGGTHPDGYDLAWLKGHPQGALATPAGWNPSQSRGMTHVEDAEVRSRMLPLGQTQGIDASLDLRSGNVVYSPPRAAFGQPFEPLPRMPTHSASTGLEQPGLARETAGFAPQNPNRVVENRRLPVLELAVAATALMLLGFLRMPYGFYTLLHFSVLCATGALFLSRRPQLDGWHWLFGALSVLYNPIFPIHLGDRQLWQIVNVFTAGAVWWGVWELKASPIGTRKSRAP